VLVLLVSTVMVSMLVMISMNVMLALITVLKMVPAPTLMDHSSVLVTMVTKVTV
jgi:hypothetical protein